MAAYTRQSTFTDGDTIFASLLNNEYDQLAAAFNVSTGHTHDGSTTGDGGPISKLFSNTLTFGTNTNNDISVTFDATSNDGVFTWMEDEDYFQFSDDILLSTNEKLLFRDSAIYIHSSADGQLDLVADTEIQIAATTVDLNGNLDVSGTLKVGSGATVSTILDEDNFSSDSATALATQQSIKAYVDAVTTSLNQQDLDFQGDSGGALDVDLDTETLTIAGGTGIDTAGSGTTLTVSINSDVATKVGTETLTNKSLTAPILTGSSSAAGSILFKEDTDNGTNAVTLIGPASTADVTVTLPAATDTLVGKATTDILTNKTLTSPVINTGVSGSAILDEDNMASDSATKLATQQSIKAYVDSQVATANELSELTDTNITSAADGALLFYDTGTSKWIDNVVSGDITIADTGVATIASSAIETAMLNANVITGQTALTSGFDNSNDFLLIHDADGGLKKISLANIAVTSGGISDIVSDTTPQLGGDLDVNGNAIVSASNGNIAITPNGSGKVILDGLSHPTADGSAGQVLTTDGSGNLSFTSKTVDTTNLVDDTSPQLGGNLDINGQDIVSTSNANIDILPNGSGVINLDGNGSSGGVSVSDGLIDIRTGTGNVAKVKFYCESSNAHAQTLQAAPHSASSNAVLVLPTTSGNLIGTGDTGTVTNTMLAGSITAAKLAGSIGDSKLSTISTAGKVDLAALEIDGGTDIGADLTSSDLIIVDDGAGGTNRKAALSRLTTFMTAQGFSTEDPTALAIALG
ncbi:putative structural protein [Pelagibacter phage HTVC115P]|nr:putative structural protein [Pelagibacter phage HTVC115P]